MNPLEKLVSLNRNILKLDITLVNNIFTNTNGILTPPDFLQSFSEKTSTTNNITTNNTNNKLQHLSEIISSNNHVMEKFISVFRENSWIGFLTQKLSTNKLHQESLNSAFTSIENASTPEQLSSVLQAPTSINSNNFLSKNLDTFNNSNSVSSSNTNIHIDKVEINDVSNIDDFAFQLQQKVQ